MSDCRLKIAEFKLTEVRAGSRLWPSLARTEAATGVRHGRTPISLPKGGDKHANGSNQANR